MTPICSQTIRRAMMIATLVASFPVLGCGEAKRGPTRYAISGSVTFNDKPIPIGFVSFEPNAALGNAGPGCGAAIKNGHYETEKNKGITGGPYIITVNGSDAIPAVLDGEEAPQGTSLFPPYKTQFDFPKSDSTWDIVVPVVSSSESN